MDATYQTVAGFLASWPNACCIIFLLLGICFVTFDWAGPMEPLPKQEFLEEAYVPIEKKDEVATLKLARIVTPKKCRLLDLPNELLLRLVDLIYDGGYNSVAKDANVYRKIFVNLLTTNRRLSAMAMHRLYHTVGPYNTVRLVSNFCKYPMAGHRVRNLVISDWIIESHDVAAHLGDIEFNINTKLASLRVRDTRERGIKFDLFEVAAGTESCGSQAELRNAVSMLLLLSCPNIEVLTIDQTNWFVPVGAYGVTLSKLRKIEINDGTFTIFTESTLAPEPPDFGFDLTHIDMNFSGTDQTTFSALVSNCTALQSFSYGVGGYLPLVNSDISPDCLIEQLETHTECLKTLRLLWSEHNTDQCVCFPIEETIYTLAHFTAVEELHIGLPGLEVYHANQDTTEQFFLELLPPNLRKLLLWDGTKVWDLDELYMATKHHFNDLREIHLCRSLKTVRSREDRLIGLFAKRGIRLTYSGDDQDSRDGAMNPPGLRTSDGVRVCTLVANYVKGRTLE
ncbi:hypothetical protein VHEMI01550 [[Torrubiella] hemipterigena]|uniref:F-box domain-containing protein n=1 Tax=[Torrubiella] hemipterigena TaxID=1531966 RepID=A0A0A1T532_9HYPO|nr:hypothetical protein VHEMI01550 [[Torrubiella] hemipterigena]